ncbi:MULTISPECIES: acyl-ACP--UDP-N-acetylglucosamine O-acyltransferase [Persicobacter]|uniref:Acyl-[acyl-carrier-protein]--UDP-N-acetylglucosamine O-acyltransferase n=1 Tax=Persicobacter diffluens TaxID=981 RepID=A0AAN4VX24_9BACT|nr:acyl-ACP--UDP-N-acetylglucosamine O-acyltransferase [Persicobacter sp. CCB-QB2]GJM61596.1 acyl-[acyl-carrier-protein]--UDP-N-acetylglucosamine O-acyltransferase [Persicobacter diffluens]
MKGDISKLANVHPEAKIGEGVTIEAFATVHKDVVIGEGTWVGPNAVIMDGARIGKNCEIHCGAAISGTPQDLKFAGEYSTTEIGDHTVIREYVTVHRGTVDRHKTVVGSHCLLMAYVHIAHDCIVGDRCILGNATQVAGHVIIEDWAILGGTTAVHQFCKIGAHTMVAGGTRLGKDVPPFAMTTREGGYSGINSVGLRRRNFSSEQINIIQETYRTIFNRGYNISKATSVAESEIPTTEERNQILDFIRNSERGIIK